MNIQLRQIFVEDAESINRLSCQLGYTSTLEETEAQIREVLSTKEHCAFVATDGDAIVGWVHAFRAVRIETKAFIEIAGLVVDEGYRGKGIGQQLVNRIREWCVEKKTATLRLRTNIRREEAHRFYEAMGFVCNKEQKIYELIIVW